jgi:hypothetical protein
MSAREGGVLDEKDERNASGGIRNIFLLFKDVFGSRI